MRQNTARHYYERQRKNRQIRKRQQRRKRYQAYYEAMMEPIYEQMWSETIKRLKTLKKAVKSLGPIPNEEIQLTKTVNYFIKIVNLATNFLDEGLISFLPDNKIEQVDDFNATIEYIAGRNVENTQYLNKSEIGEKVNAENLLLGRFSSIGIENVPATTKTIRINGKLYKVEVEFTPISLWLKGKVISKDGHYVNISQKRIATVDKQLTDRLLEVINGVLE